MPAQVLKATRYEVQIKSKWSEPWTLFNIIYPIAGRKCCAPDIGECLFCMEFGKIKQHDSNQFQSEIPGNFANQYIRIILIQFGSFDGTDGIETERRKVLWTGVIVDDKREYYTDETVSPAAGDQYFTAYGLEWLLTRCWIKYSYIEPVGATGNADELHRNIKFNEVHSRGRSLGKDILGNRAETANTDDNVFDFSDFAPGKKPEEWNNYQIGQYLLKYFKPENPKFKFNDLAESILEQLVEVHDFHQKNLYEALNQLIDRRRGCGFFLEIEDDSPELDAADKEILIRVFSTSEIGITFGETFWPPNDEQGTFNVTGDYPFNHLLDDIVFRLTANLQYDNIIVQGPLLKSVATFSGGRKAKGEPSGVTTILPDWSEEQEKAYKAVSGTPEEIKAERASDRFEAVYQHFRLVLNSDGTTGESENITGIAVPLCLDDGTVDETVAAKFWQYGPVPILRDLPFQKGVDYSVSPPKNELEDDEALLHDPEYVPLAVYVGNPDPEALRALRVDKANSINETVPNAHVTPLDRFRGFKLKSSYNHAYALNHFDGATPDDDKPAADYSTLIAIAFFETDQRPRIVLDNEDLGTDPTDMVRQLFITVPWAEYWYVTPKCSTPGFDFYDDGNPRLIRDGKPALETVAAYCRIWYGKQRQAVQIPVKEIDDWAPLGSVITGITGVNLDETIPINTIVSALHFDFAPKKGQRRTVVETGWNNLDFLNESFARRLGIRMTHGGAS